MIEIGGFLKGLPRVIQQHILSKLNSGDIYDRCEILSKWDGYFLEIEIIDIEGRRDFPLIPLKKDGKLIYDEDLLIGSTIVLNKIQMEDMYKYYRNFRYRVIRGYYYHEGRDVALANALRDLFNERLEYKKKGSDLQLSIKLIMNSIYGKTIQKVADSRFYTVTDDELQKVIGNRFNLIKNLSRMGDSKRWVVEEYADVSQGTNYAHLGSEILAMSKRIMSEVMCLAEDNGIKIYY